MSRPGPGRTLIALRTDLRPGDMGTVIRLHGIIHARECGFDPTFEAYVAGPLADFVKAADPRGRLWIADQDGEVVGCIAIVPASADTAQLRWFLVAPANRGQGLGRILLGQALDFARDQGFARVILWTVRGLDAAARLYQSAGFNLAEERPGRMGGQEVLEQKYALDLP